jgi:hypothetical protein
MSGIWTPLLPAATVGVGRAPLAAPDVPAPIAEALAALESLPAAERLLKTAAVLDVCLQAGLTFTPAPALIAPAEAETRPPLPMTAADVLRVMLEEAPPRLAAQALAASDRAGYRLPPSLLSLALEQRRTRPALAPLADAVLGKRGRWLLATRGETAPVASSDPLERWQTGTLTERRAALAELLAADRADGRELFRAALPQLPASERAELLTVVVDTVTPEDEPLFESLLKDRGREVRLLAAAGLQRLPASAWAARMRERVQALVRREGKQVLLEPPAEADPGWSADGIEVKRPKHESLGERAWWLYELARRVPLSVWQAATGLDASGLLGWAKSSDWKEALRRGWTESLAVSPELDGLLAFGRAGMRPWEQAPLFGRIPTAEAERFWLGMLQGKRPPLTELLGSYEQTLGIADTLPHALAETALAIYARDLAAERREHWHLAQLGQALSILLPVDLLPTLRALPGLDSLNAGNTPRQLEQHLNLRLRFAAALAAGASGPGVTP